VGGLIAGLVLSGTELVVGATWDGEQVNEELLQLANEIEGHPDNVAPVSERARERAREAARKESRERQRLGRGREARQREGGRGGLQRAPGGNLTAGTAACVTRLG
jgi:hypothetical protein